MSSLWCQTNPILFYSHRCSLSLSLAQCYAIQAFLCLANSFFSGLSVRNLTCSSFCPNNNIIMWEVKSSLYVWDREVMLVCNFIQEQPSKDQVSCQPRKQQHILGSPAVHMLQNDSQSFCGYFGIPADIFSSTSWVPESASALQDRRLLYFSSPSAQGLLLDLLPAM